MGKATGVYFQIIDAFPESDGAKTYGKMEYDAEGKPVITISMESKNIVSTAFHELTHWMKDVAPAEWERYSDYVMKWMEEKNQTTTEALIQEYMERYGLDGFETGRAKAIEEIVCDASEAMLDDKNAVFDFADRNRGIAQKIVDFFTDLFETIRNYISAHGKATDIGRALSQQETLVRDMRDLWVQAFDAAVENNKTEATKNADQTAGEVRYSIEYTTDNKPVAVIEDDILSDVPKAEWIKTVKRTISEKFSGGIPISGRLIKVNSITRSEFTNSKYSKYLKSSDGTVYTDKLKSANNIDDILLASTSYINENLKHARKDNFKEFARGDVQIRIGDQDYSAKVIVGLTSNNKMVLYDIVDFSKTYFTTKKENKSIGYANHAGNLRNDLFSDPTISQDNSAVNTQYMQDSEKNNTETSSASENLRRSISDVGKVDLSTLQKENDRLRQANAHLKEQFKLTQGKKPDRNAVKKLCRKILRE